MSHVDTVTTGAGAVDAGAGTVAADLHALAANLHSSLSITPSAALCAADDGAHCDSDDVICITDGVTDDVGTATDDDDDAAAAGDYDDDDDDDNINVIINCARRAAPLMSRAVAPDAVPHAPALSVCASDADDATMNFYRDVCNTAAHSHNVQALNTEIQHINHIAANNMYECSFASDLDLQNEIHTIIKQSIRPATSRNIAVLFQGQIILIPVNLKISSRLSTLLWPSPLLYQLNAEFPFMGEFNQLLRNGCKNNPLWLEHFPNGQHKMGVVAVFAAVYKKTNMPHYQYGRGSMGGGGAPDALGTGATTRGRNTFRQQQSACSRSLDPSEHLNASRHQRQQSSWTSPRRSRAQRSQQQQQQQQQMPPQNWRRRNQHAGVNGGSGGGGGDFKSASLGLYRYFDFAAVILRNGQIVDHAIHGYQSNVAQMIGKHQPSHIYYNAQPDDALDTFLRYPYQPFYGAMHDRLVPVAVPRSAHDQFNVLMFCRRYECYCAFCFALRDTFTLLLSGLSPHTRAAPPFVPLVRPLPPPPPPPPSPPQEPSSSTCACLQPPEGRSVEHAGDCKCSSRGCGSSVDGHNDCSSNSNSSGAATATTTATISTTTTTTNNNTNNNNDAGDDDGNSCNGNYAHNDARISGRRHRNEVGGALSHHHRRRAQRPTRRRSRSRSHASIRGMPRRRGVVRDDRSDRGDRGERRAPSPARRPWRHTLRQRHQQRRRQRLRHGHHQRVPQSRRTLATRPERMQRLVETERRLAHRQRFFESDRCRRARSRSWSAYKYAPSPTTRTRGRFDALLSRQRSDSLSSYAGGRRSHSSERSDDSRPRRAGHPTSTASRSRSPSPSPSHSSSSSVDAVETSSSGSNCRRIGDDNAEGRDVGGRRHDQRRRPHQYHHRRSRHTNNNDDGDDDDANDDGYDGAASARLRSAVVRVAKARSPTPPPAVDAGSTAEPLSALIASVSARSCHPPDRLRLHLRKAPKRLGRYLEYDKGPKAARQY